MSYHDFHNQVKLRNSKAIGELATFVTNKKLPVYNWFYYKEGFSRDLVWKFLDDLSSGTVLDPFCGSGTTLLACKQRGIDSIGFDVLPVSTFATAVKTGDYEPQELKDTAKKFLKAKFHPLRFSYPPIMKRAFNKYTLDDITFFREHLKTIEDRKIRNFFLLGLMNAALRCSWAWKDGGVIKIKKKNVPPLRVMLRRTLYNMIRDFERFETKPCTTIMEKGDARRMRLENGSVEAIFTSPPYLNNIDYTKVYEIEQLIIGEKEAPALRSFVGLGKDVENEILPELDLPSQAVLYFEDMNSAIKEMYRVLASGPVGIVVGNAYVNGQIIDSDAILAYLATKTGFDLKAIHVLNERYALEERTKKKGILRESMIVLEKS